MEPAEFMNAIRRALGLSRAPAQPPERGAPHPTPQPDGAGRGLLRGRTAVVVGAGVNIGLGVAREFAREEAELFITNSSQDDLDKVVLALRADGCTPRAMHSDVTAPGAAEALLARLDEHRITPDILVLNVGVHAAPGEPDLAEMERVFRTNVIAPLHLSRRIATRMRGSGRGGAIIFLSSIHEWSLFGEPLYSSSKAAVGMMMRELAAELASARIRVNAIAPGWVAANPDGTPLPHRLTPLYKTSIPPSFIGKAAVFLAADSLSGHTSGTVLTVDGGASLLNSIVNPTFLSEAE
jgi:NAD(P)-dependent dehydrogenase (short-subunit alcohol dehydrogenase family)